MFRNQPNYKPASAVAAQEARRSGHAVRPALRDARIVILVAAIFVLGNFDLVLTLVAHPMGLLNERNPVARVALGRGVATLITFKICLNLVGCALLLLARATASGKVAAISIFLTYAGLAVWWSECVNEFDRVTCRGSMYVASNLPRPRAPCNPKGQDVPRARSSPDPRHVHGHDEPRTITCPTGARCERPPNRLCVGG